MSKEAYEYIAKRCEDALLENEEYIALEKSEADPVELQESAEIICYQKGFRDAIRMFVDSL